RRPEGASGSGWSFAAHLRNPHRTVLGGEQEFDRVLRHAAVSDRRDHVPATTIERLGAQAHDAWTTLPSGRRNAQPGVLEPAPQRRRAPPDDIRSALAVEVRQVSAEEPPRLTD